MSRIPTKDNRLGVQHVAGPDKRLLDVVFIHGLAGDAWTTWMSDPDDDSTFWPDWLAKEFPSLGIWTVGYAADPSRWKGESMPIADQGTNLVNALELDGIGQRPVVFITHSLGGILAKQLLRHASSYGVVRWKRIADSTGGMVFLGTPHSGADIANFVTFVSAVLRLNESVKELQAHNWRLRDLHNWFRAYHGVRPFPVRTYCETREVRPGLPLLKNLGIKLPKGVLVVNQTSAEPNIPDEVAVPLPEDHISICKPPNREADMYRGVVALSNELTTAISSCAADHTTTTEPNNTIDAKQMQIGQLLNELKSLPGAWFEELVFTYDHNNAVSSKTAPQASRAMELLTVLRSKPAGLAQLCDHIERLRRGT